MMGYRWKPNAIGCRDLLMETLQPLEASPTFPVLPLDQVPLFIQRSLVIGETTTLKEFRQ